jgi:hypothetical protein
LLSAAVRCFLYHNKSPGGLQYFQTVWPLGKRKGAKNLSDLPQEVLQTAQVGADNILLNSGFVGDYESSEMGNKQLSESSEMFSPALLHWDGEAVVIDDDFSKSGKSATVGHIEQIVRLIDGENYVVSFYAKGGNVKINIGGFEYYSELSNEYIKHNFTFKSQFKNSVFVVSGENATICNLKLERGTIPTDWTPSVLDNDKIAEKFTHLQYLQNAIRNGSTDIIGGLILSNILQVGNYKDNIMQNVTAGINGSYYDDNSVAFWAGGSLEHAINTVSKFTQKQIPSEEDWQKMANFVATHGGAVFMRGYLNALGVALRGKIETVIGKNKLVIDPSSNSITAYNGEKVVFKIDYENSSMIFNGIDCTEGALCTTRDIILSASGLEFKGDNVYGAISSTMEHANINKCDVTEANISVADLQKIKVPDGDFSGDKVECTIFRDKDGFLKAF